MLVTPVNVPFNTFHWCIPYTDTAGSESQMRKTLSAYKTYATYTTYEHPRNVFQDVYEQLTYPVRLNTYPTVFCNQNSAGGSCEADGLSGALLKVLTANKNPNGGRLSPNFWELYLQRMDLQTFRQQSL